MIKYILLVSLVIAVSEAIPKPCFKQTDCDQDQCCLKVGNLLNVCRSRVKEGGLCMKHEINKLFHKDVYVGRCPCAEGLECRKKSEKGLTKFVHKCQPNGDEIPDETDEDDENPEETEEF